MKRLNSQKGIARIIAIVILAVILVGGGTYYFNQQQAKPASKSNTSSSTWVNPFESSSIKWKTFSIKNQYMSNDKEIEFSTATWQTFFIPMYGIQFSFLPVAKGIITNDYSSSKSPVIDFSDMSDKDKAKKLTVCNQYGYYYQNNNPLLSDESAIEIRVPIRKVANIKDWYDACEKPINYPKGIPVTEMKIVNGNDILIVKDKTQYIYDQYMFVKNSIVYIFDFDNRKATAVEQQKIQQILESIKFSKPTINL